MLKKRAISSLDITDPDILHNSNNDTIMADLYDDAEVNKLPTPPRIRLKNRARLTRKLKDSPVQLGSLHTSIRSENMVDTSQNSTIHDGSWANTVATPLVSQEVCLSPVNITPLSARMSSSNTANIHSVPGSCMRFLESSTSQIPELNKELSGVALAVNNKECNLHQSSLPATMKNDYCSILSLTKAPQDECGANKSQITQAVSSSSHISSMEKGQSRDEAATAGSNLLLSDSLVTSVKRQKRVDDAFNVCQLNADSLQLKHKLLRSTLQANTESRTPVSLQVCPRPVSDVPTTVYMHTQLPSSSVMLGNDTLIRNAIAEPHVDTIGGVMKAGLYDQIAGLNKMRGCIKGNEDTFGSSFNSTVKGAVSPSQAYQSEPNNNTVTFEFRQKPPRTSLQANTESRTHVSLQVCAPSHSASHRVNENQLESNSIHASHCINSASEFAVLGSDVQASTIVQESAAAPLGHAVLLTNRAVMVGGKRNRSSPSSNAAALEPQQIMMDAIMSEETSDVKSQLRPLRPRLKLKTRARLIQQKNLPNDIPHKLPDVDVANTVVPPLVSQEVCYLSVVTKVATSTLLNHDAADCDSLLHDRNKLGVLPKHVHNLRNEKPSHKPTYDLLDSQKQSVIVDESSCYNEDMDNQGAADLPSKRMRQSVDGTFSLHLFSDPDFIKRSLDLHLKQVATGSYQLPLDQ